MHLRRKTVSQLYALSFYVIAYALVGIIWEFVDTGGGTTFAGPVTGGLIGLALGAFEMFGLTARTDRLPFMAAVFVKSLIYLVVIAVPWLVIGVAGGFLKGFGMIEFLEWMFSVDFLREIVLIFLIHLLIVFLRQLNVLLGPGKLIRYITGRYHKPRVEKRVFMFLDLKSSTALAEKLDGQTYFSFLNTFFRDISEPIIERGAEIYQYIGDEIVLTWPVREGLHDANCIRIFVEILAEIHSKRNFYLEKYGHIPEFKAGLHFGDVITAEIGDIKKEIVYSGDVLNTTARIQSKCNEFDQLLIASEELVSALTLPEFTMKNPLGDVHMRGKSKPMSLVGLVWN